MLDEQIDGFLPGPNALVIDAIFDTNVLGAHEGQRQQQSSLVINHGMMLPEWSLFGLAPN